MSNEKLKNNPNLIGISGKIGSGKDTVGSILQDYSDDNAEDYKIKKFATKLKEIAALLIGCDVSDFEDRKFKETELGEEWWYCIADDGSYVPYEQNLHKNKVVNLEKLTPRKLLQLLGTEAGRQIIHPNIWVNALFADYNGYHNGVGEDEEIFPNWIITDVRFPNEAQAIKDRGGIVIRVNRLGVDKFTANFPQTLHPSEIALDNYDFDIIIDNNGSLEELVEKVKQLKLV